MALQAITRRGRRLRSRAPLFAAMGRSIRVFAWDGARRGNRGGAAASNAQASDAPTFCYGSGMAIVSHPAVPWRRFVASNSR